MVLGDHLNEDKKRAYIHGKLKPGQVIYRFCDFTTPPKYKYLVIVKVQTETTVLVINSKINPFIQSLKHLLDVQVPIKKSSHSFLDHDSFVDCTTTASIETADLFREIMAQMDILRGEVTQELKTSLIDAIQQSFTLTQFEISELVASLGA